MEVIDSLDKILSLHQERIRTIHGINNLHYKRRCEYLLEISPEEKSQLVAKANRIYNAKIAAVYNQLNQGLLADGKPAMNNPFERKSEKNENRTCEKD